MLYFYTYRSLVIVYILVLLLQTTFKNNPLSTMLYANKSII